jgi:hypothetical protein
MVVRLLVLAWLLATVACVPVPTPPVITLEEPPSADLEPLEMGEGVAVVPSREGATGFVADCVQKGLVGGLRRNRVLTADEARDAFFPWLEPSQMPRGDAAVQTFVARPAVAAKLRALALRYLVVVDLSTTDDDLEGGELLLAGGAFGKASARVSAEIVDLEAGCCRPGGAARATGIRGYAHVVIYGVIVVSSVQQPACDRLSAALVQALGRSQSSAP